MSNLTVKLFEAETLTFGQLDYGTIFVEKGVVWMKVKPCDDPYGTVNVLRFADGTLHWLAEDFIIATNYGFTLTANGGNRYE